MTLSAVLVEVAVVVVGSSLAAPLSSWLNASSLAASKLWPSGFLQARRCGSISTVDCRPTP
jgi:hypothetical protein